MKLRCIMRKIIVTEFMTLDGVIEAPGGKETPHPHGGWQSNYRSPEGGKYKMEELSSVDALLTRNPGLLLFCSGESLDSQLWRVGRNRGPAADPQKKHLAPVDSRPAARARRTDPARDDERARHL